jgi:hypothetical protein
MNQLIQHSETYEKELILKNICTNVYEKKNNLKALFRENKDSQKYTG